MKDFYFSDEEDEKNFLTNRKWLIHSLILDAVKKSFSEDLESIVVFRIINSFSNFIMVSELKKTDWINSLDKCLEYYESVEEYEICDEINNLKKEIKNGSNKSNRRKK